MVRVVFVIFGFGFWGRGVCVDEVSAFAPDGLEAAFEPGEFSVESVVVEFAKEALYVGRVWD